MRKTIMWILFAIVMIGGSFMYLNSTYYTEISKYYNAVIYSVDEGIEEETAIRLYGKVNKNIFEENTFVGNLTVGDKLTYNFIMYSEDEYYHGIVYDEENYEEIIGTVSTSKEFEQLIAQFDILDSEYNEDVYVIAPVKTVGEAEVIRQFFMEE